MLIAFCGIDGSGKTTFAKQIVEYLRKKKRSVILIKPFEYFFLRKKRDSSKILNKSSKPFYYKFWAFLALIDNLFYYVFRIKPLLNMYEFVICDRYFYDFVFSFEYYGLIFKWFSSFYLKFIPKPDFLFVLNINPIIAKIREKGVKHEFSFYNFMNKHYLSLDGFGDLIDTSKSFNKNFDFVFDKLGLK